MGFTIPTIQETDSWGPSADAVDADKALTYAPFTRSDKFGRGARSIIHEMMNPTSFDVAIARS
jgi:hypothetical protein